MSLAEKENNLKPDTRHIHHHLVEACKKGDQKAMIELYKAYYKTMFNTSLRITGNPAEAEDIMQDSFLDAFQKIDQFDGRSVFGSWLKRIVINKSIDHLRKKKVLLPLEDINPEIPDLVEEDHLQVLSYKVDYIKDVIANLPENYRVIISLYLLEGYDHEEIAEILGISYDNSRARYSRAKKKLLSDLQNNNLHIVN